MHPLHAHKAPSTEEWVIIIPQTLRADVMRLFHAAPPFGHLGAERMYQLMRDKVIWPSMRRDIFEYVADCIRCNLNGKHKLRRHGKLRETPQPNTPGLMISIDLAGPLPLTERGNKYLLCIIDHCSRFTVVVPQKTATAEETATNFVDRYIYTFGIPKAIVGRILLGKYLVKWLKFVE